MSKITIIDYGVGNIASLKNAFSVLNISVELTSDATKILDAEKLILPGVGAFPSAIKKIKKIDWIKFYDKKLLKIHRF